MIFRTQKLELLKQLQNKNDFQHLQQIQRRILKDVWPRDSKNSFCQTIQSIAIAWMNQFLTLLENWLSETSQKYLSKISQLEEPLGTNHKIQEYLLNFTKYIQLMENPLLTSIKNIQKLYLRYPSDQMIQQPKKPQQNRNQGGVVSQNKKKKSLSIQSFTQNSLNKSGSKSRGRKMSFFSNSVKTNPNLVQNLTKEYKKFSNLNTTVKKIKKQHSFIKTNQIANSTYSGGFKQTQIRPSIYNKDSENTTNTKILKQKLEQRLSSTCSSTFFNQIVLQKPSTNLNPKVNQSEMIDESLKSCKRIQFPQKQTPKNSLTRNESLFMQQSLRRQILSQIQNKQRQNNDNLLKKLQQKLNDKFQSFINRIIHPQQVKKMSGDNLSTKQNEIIQRKSVNTLKQQQKVSQNQVSQYSKQQDCIISNEKSSQTQQAQKSINLQNANTKQSDFSLQEKTPKCLSGQIDSFDVKYVQKDQVAIIPQAKVIQNCRLNRQSRVNSSSILQKDPSKIIKPKIKNNLSYNFKENLPISNQKQTKGLQTAHMPEQQKRPLTNQVHHDVSSDSIQIIDQYSHLNSIQNRSKDHYSLNRKLGKSVPKVTKDINPTKSEFSVQKVQNNKNQDKFYTKRVNELKFDMDICFKNYKEACQKLALPVNQTFLLLFSNSYREFCQKNALQIVSKQIKDILSKHSSNQQVKAKLPVNCEKFLLQSLGKIQKMVNLKFPPQKKVKIQDYAQKCIKCIQNIYFQMPDLCLKSESEIMSKIRLIKASLKPINVQ